MCIHTLQDHVSTALPHSSPEASCDENVVDMVPQEAAVAGAGDVADTQRNAGRVADFYVRMLASALDYPSTDDCMQA